MKSQPTLARIKKGKETFEISIDPNKALQFKQGEINDLNEVLYSDNIFTDAKKGQLASTDQLQNAFNTTNNQEIAKIIILQGEIQITAEHRAKEQKERKNYLINLIHKQAVDPKTGYPHPPSRIEAALEQGKVHISPHKTIEEQLPDIISKLRPIIPISIEKKQATLTIPGQFSGKLYPYVKKNSKVLKEEWKPDGSWRIKVEVPAGLFHEIVETISSMTHGETIIENE